MFSRKSSHFTCSLFLIVTLQTLLLRAPRGFPKGFDTLRASYTLIDMDDESCTTCLSSDCHDDNIKDHLLHFLGCIEISERHDFLKESKYKLWIQETRHWIESQQLATGNAERTYQEIKREAEITSERKMKAWRDDCLSELRRIDFLRLKLREDPQEKHLVDRVEKSRDDWKKSEEYKTNVDIVKAWSAERRKGKSKPYENPRKESMDKPYEPERDVNAGFMQFEKKDSSDWVFTPVSETPDSDQAIWGKYPNQKITVQRLLHPVEGQWNLLDKNKYGIRLKYFHIPSNNMTVSSLLLSLLSHC